MIFMVIVGVVAQMTLDKVFCSYSLLENGTISIDVIQDNQETYLLAVAD